MTAYRHIILVLIKVMVTSALVYWLYVQMETGATLEVVTGIEPGRLLLAVCLHCMVFILSALRWWLLLSTTNVSLPFSRALPSYYLGVFLNNFLPTSMGGDVARIVHLRLRGLSTKALISSSLVDRIIGLTVVTMIGACSVLASPMIPLDPDKATALVLVAFAVLLSPLLLMTPHAVRLVNRFTEKYHGTRLRLAILEIVSLCQSYRRARSVLLAAYSITVLMQCIVVFIYFLLGNGIGVDIPLLTYFTFIPLVFIVASLPISIGGLGVREGALVGMLVATGVDSQLAISLSILYLIVLWIASLPGAVAIFVNSIMRRLDRNTA
jgi:uncharacterized protein (TIRG00374 family)